MAVRAAREWLARVVIDLKVARNCLGGPDPTMEGAIYHCQQAAEKLVKAVLVAEGTHPPRVHHIRALVDCLASAHPLHPELANLDQLSIYSFVYHYPAGDDIVVPAIPSEAEVEAWIKLIERLKSEVERRYPLPS